MAHPLMTEDEERRFTVTLDGVRCLDCRCVAVTGCGAAEDQKKRMLYREKEPKPGGRVLMAGPTGGIPGTLGADLRFIPDSQKQPPVRAHKRRAVS